MILKDWLLWIWLGFMIMKLIIYPFLLAYKTYPRTITYSKGEDVFGFFLNVVIILTLLKALP